MPHYPDSLIIQPQLEHKYTIIWLHGLGANAHDFFNLAPQLQFKLKANTKFIFPNAPEQKVSINNSAIMPSWYDIYHVNSVKGISLPDLKNSSTYIQKLIDFEVHSGLSFANIILAGFSQGGVVAIDAALNKDCKDNIKSVLALSTYHPEITLLNSAKNLSPNICFMHGTEDCVIPLEAAQNTYKQLQSLNYKTNLKTYPMAHEVCPQQIIDINNYFSSQCN